MESKRSEKEGEHVDRKDCLNDTTRHGGGSCLSIDGQLSDDKYSAGISRDAQRTFGNIQGRFSEPPERSINLQKHSGNIHEHSRNVQGMFRERSTDIQGTFKAH